MNRKKYKSNIVQKVMIMAAVSILIVTAVFLVVFNKYKKQYEESKTRISDGGTIVALNEIYNLAGDDNLHGENNEIVKEKLQALMTELRSQKTVLEEDDIDYIKVFFLIAIGAIVLTYTLIYVLVLRPFCKLEDFAGEIATGNLDKNLKYNRVNMFGEFTWAFDHMRREIKKARQCEQEAVENNKTVIATLSHDIKTPIASIRGYSEALAENMDSTPERRKRYIDVIIKKCDEVTKITNDMFIHSLHDLDKLIIKKEPVEIHKVISETVEAMEGGRTDIILGEIKEGVLKKADSGRIAQVIENIINNARKYAPGNIYINTEVENNSLGDMDSREYKIRIKDEGKGILPEDMPFVFDKFYRGKNHGDEPGAGLGLFIVKYVMGQMDGRVEIINCSDGLEVTLTFRES